MGAGGISSLSHRFVLSAPRTKFAGRIGFAEFVSPALVDVAKLDVAAPSRLVAFSSPYHMRRIQGPGVPRTEQDIINELCRYRARQRLQYAQDRCRLRESFATFR